MRKEIRFFLIFTVILLQLVPAWCSALRRNSTRRRNNSNRQYEIQRFQKNGKREYKILGGSVVPLEQTPYMADLLFNEESTPPVDLDVGKYDSLCGGTLIFQYVVLTAAHCVDDLTDPSQWQNGMLLVKLGSLVNTLQSSEIGQNIIFEVDNIVYNDQFNPGSDGDSDTSNSGDVAPYDIALLFLHTPAVYSEYVQRAELDTSQEDTVPVGTQLTISGWGDLFEGATINDDTAYLQTTTVSVTDFGACNTQYNNLLVEDLQFCAGSADGSTDFCSGDSGGGAILSGTNIVSGIISYSDGCGIAGQSSVYTRVSSYLQWIDSTCQANIGNPFE